jgi:hypothetical protein
MLLEPGGVMTASIGPSLVRIPIESLSADPAGPSTWDCSSIDDRGHQPVR